MDWAPDIGSPPLESGLASLDIGVASSIEASLQQQQHSSNGSQLNLSMLDHIQEALFRGDAATRQINWALAIVFALVMLATAVGNLFVIIAILIERNLRSVGNYLVLSLATADLLVALAVMPLASVYQIVDAWTLGVWLCEFWTSSDVFSCTASILHLLAIALDRYWAVTRVDYIRCQRNERHILCMIAIVWITAAIISLAPFFGWMDDNFESRITQHKQCLVSQNLTYQMLATCATFFVPVSMTLVLYWNIYQVARKRIRRKPGNRLKVSQQLPSASSSSATPGPHSPHRKQASSERLSSAVATSSAPTGVEDTACVCSCPCHELVAAAGSGATTNLSTGAPPVGAAASSPVKARLPVSASDTTVRLEDVGKPVDSGTAPSPTSNNQQTGRQSSPVQVTLAGRPASSSNLATRRQADNCCTVAGAGPVLASDDSASLNLSFTGAGSPTKQQLLARLDSRGLLRSQLEAPPQGGPHRRRRKLAVLGWLQRSLSASRGDKHNPPDTRCTTSTTTGCCYQCSSGELLQHQQQQQHQQQCSTRLATLSVGAGCGRHAGTVVETVAATTANLATSALRPPMANLGGQLHNSIQFQSSAQEGIESKRERKAAKTLAIITGIFVICWLPFFSMALAMPLLDLQPPNYLFNLLMWLGYVNSMLNPIIYTIFSPDFRRAFKRLLCGASSTRPNHQQSRSQLNGRRPPDDEEGHLKSVFERAGRLLELRTTLAGCCLLHKISNNNHLKQHQVMENNKQLPASSGQKQHSVLSSSSQSQSTSSSSSPPGNNHSCRLAAKL